MNESASLSQTAEFKAITPKPKIRYKLILAAAAVITAAGISIFAVYRKLVREGYFLRNAVAAETAHYQVSGAMLACFFQQERDAFSDSEKKPDSSIPLTEQYAADGVTWYDYFMQQARERITYTLKRCENAAADGFAISAEDAEACRKQAAETLLTDYPAGVHTDDLAEVLILQKTADAYTAAAKSAVSIPDEELDAYLETHRPLYLTFRLLAYRFPYTAPADSLAAVRGAAYSAATSLAECHTVNEFKENVAAYLTARGDSEAQIRKAADALVTSDTAGSFQKDIQVWILQNEAKTGDTIIVENPEGQYFEVCQMLEEPQLDESPTVNLRVISLTNAKYGDAQKSLSMAEDLRKRCVIQDASPDAFAALASAYSEDTVSKAEGGLISGYAQSRTTYGENVSKWAFSAQRKQGDMLVSETPDAALLVYFDSRNDRNAWESAVFAHLRSERLTAFNDRIEAQKVTLYDVSIDA